MGEPGDSIPADPSGGGEPDAHLAQLERELVLVHERLERAERELRASEERHARLAATETELRASEERFRRTFEESPVGAAIVSLDSRFLRVNAELCRFTGYSQEELLRLTFADITHPADRAASVEISRRLFAGEIERFRIEKRYLRKDGATVWARTSARLIRDSQGRPLYSLPLVEDITERRQTDELLALFKHSIDVNSDAAYWLDPEGAFVYVSESGCQVLGYERAELERLRVFDVNPRATPEVWRSLWERLRGGAPTVRLESVHRRKNGELFPVEISSTYVRFGQREYLCGFARDISER
jgi:PAS domain S-box-containing protein